MVLLPSQICPFLPHCAEDFRFFLSESISFFTASGMTSSSSSPFPALFFEGWIFMDLTAHVRDIHTWTLWAPPGVLFPPSLQFSPQSSLIWLVLNMKVHLLLPVLIFSFYKKKKNVWCFYTVKWQHPGNSSSILPWKQLLPDRLLRDPLL